jgi:ABC-2 type transport system permease protein
MSAIATTVDEFRATPAVPLGRLVQVELRKMVDTRAGMWLFAAIGVVTVAAVTLFLFFAEPQDLTFANFAGVALTPQGFLLPILGILLITSEWGQRTALVTFTLEPNRARVVVAKVLAALIVSLIAVAVLLGVAALGNVLGSAIQDGDGSWTFGGQGLSYVLILQIGSIIQGLAFGMILMNSAAAIVTYFVLPLVFGIVFGLVTALEDVAPWVDIGTAQTPLFEFDEALSGSEWAHLGVASLIWIALPLVAGVIRLLRAEVKSA